MLILLPKLLSCKKDIDISAVREYDEFAGGAKREAVASGQYRNSIKDILLYYCDGPALFHQVPDFCKRQDYILPIKIFSHYGGKNGG